MTLQAHPDRIFVAGATGFLGAGVVYALLQAGASVTALALFRRILGVAKAQRE